MDTYLKKIDLFQQLLLMMLQFSDHCKCILYELNVEEGKRKRNIGNDRVCESVD